MKINKLLVNIGLCISVSEANRKIKEGAVFLNNIKVINFEDELQVNTGDNLRLGKKDLTVFKDHIARSS